MQPKEIKNSAFLTELRAGATTFATMAYIIAVNVSSKSNLQAMSHLLTSEGLNYLPKWWYLCVQ
jgi:AGZA family xanthine/uracil permease-like MFS transporter